jgi:hypothetical protein
MRAATSSFVTPVLNMLSEVVAVAVALVSPCPMCFLVARQLYQTEANVPAARTKETARTFFRIIMRLIELTVGAGLYSTGPQEPMLERVTTERNGVAQPSG